METITTLMTVIVMTMVMTGYGSNEDKDGNVTFLPNCCEHMDNGSPLLHGVPIPDPGTLMEVITLHVPLSLSPNFHYILLNFPYLNISEGIKFYIVVVTNYH
jgi:hypothetical protein